MYRTLVLATGVLLLGTFSRSTLAQEQPTFPPLEIGATAPDFALPGATRYGVLKDPIRLSDFKGKTVVLAFFFRARTRG